MKYIMNKEAAKRPIRLSEKIIQVAHTDIYFGVGRNVRKKLMSIVVDNIGDHIYERVMVNRARVWSNIRGNVKGIVVSYQEQTITPAREL